MTKEKLRQRGGKRDGAGRPPGSGKYGESTKAIRIPQSLVPKIKQFLIRFGEEKGEETLSCFTPSLKKEQSRPFFYEKVSAGFPLPAEGSLEDALDLNEYVSKNPATTFYVRVQGESMRNAGIHPNDILVVDRSLDAKNGNVIIALIEGEFTVKRLKISKTQVWLMPENENFSPIVIKEEMHFSIWGVVTNVIHSLV